MNESQDKKMSSLPKKNNESLSQKPPLDIKGTKVNRTHVKGPKEQPSLVADAQVLFFSEHKKKKKE